MQLDQASARIAPRTPWQAMDMGTHLYRAWWKPLTLVWLSFSMPVLLLALWLTVSGHSGYGALLLWWLKPVLERPLLEYCARTLFNQPVTLPTLWREFHRYALPGLLPWLLWRRIYLTRSFSVPVSQLENQHGHHYRERIRVLHMGQPNRASMLTLLMAHIEFIISYAFTVLVMMMMPGQYYLSDIDWMLTGTHYATLGLITWYLTLTVLQPLYVASGFALYLNKRTWLEGWDLELGMRRIGERRRALTSTTLAVLFLLPVLSLAPAQQARASNPQQDAIEVVAGPDFMPIEVQEQWRLRSDNDTMEALPEDQQPEWLVDFFKWLFDAGGTRDYSSLPSLADILRILLWSAVIALALWTLWYYRHWLAALPVGHQRLRKPVTHIAGLDIRQASLPANLSESVFAALDRGDAREALSLLYRATLSRLASNGDIPVLAGATETEVLQHCRNTHDDKVGVAILAALTPLWISTAWAHRPPAAEQIRLLVHQWNSHFANSPPPQEPA